jgi:hypothetical protein
MNPAPEIHPIQIAQFPFHSGHLVTVTLNPDDRLEITSKPAMTPEQSAVLLAYCQNEGYLQISG